MVELFTAALCLEALPPFHAVAGHVIARSSPFRAEEFPTPATVERT